MILNTIASVLASARAHALLTVKLCLELEKTVDRVAKAIAKIEKTEKERCETIKEMTSSMEELAAKQVAIKRSNDFYQVTILLLQVDVRNHFVNAKDVLEVCLKGFICSCTQNKRVK